MPLPHPVRQAAAANPLARRDTTKTQIAIIAVCVVLIVAICTGVAGWYLWRLRRKPKRVQQVHTTAKSVIRIDDPATSAQPVLMNETSGHIATGSGSIGRTAGGGVLLPPQEPRGIGGVEGWLQSTQQRPALIGSTLDVPRTPRSAPAVDLEGRISPPPPPVSASHSATPFDPSYQPATQPMHSRHSSGQSHHQEPYASLSGSPPAHARPFAYIKNIFAQNSQQKGSQPEAGGIPTAAQDDSSFGTPAHPEPQLQPLAMHDHHYTVPGRPPRPESLALTQSANELHPDASASQYGGRAGRGSRGDDGSAPSPGDQRGRASMGMGRRSSYGGISSQGGLPLPSLYLPSEPGESSLPGALPIGESVLASPLDQRHQTVDIPRTRTLGRKPGSNFVVTNATHSDEE